MKKLWLVLVAIVVLAVGVGAYFMLAPDAQKIKILLDTKAKPEIEKTLTEEFGEPVELSYKDSESVADGLLLHDLALTAKNNPDKKIVAKTALLSTLVYDTEGWGLSINLDDISGGGGLSGESVIVKKFRTTFDGEKVTFDGFSARNLQMKKGDESMVLENADFSGIEIAGGEHVKVAKGTLNGFSGNPDGTEMKVTSVELEGLEASESKELFILNKGSINGVDIKDPRSEGGLENVYIEGAYFDGKENIIKLGKGEVKNMRFMEEGDGFNLVAMHVAELPQVDLDEPHTWGFGSTTFEGLDIFNDNKKMASVAGIEAKSINSPEELGQVFKIKDLFVDAQAMDPEDRAALEMIGLKELRMDMTLDYMAKLKEETVALNELSINGQDLGDLKVTAKVSGVKIDLADPDKSLEASQNTAMIDGFGMKYEDKGLVKKSLENQAKKTGMTYEQFVEQQVKPMLTQAKQMNSPEITQLAKAMEKFLSDPGTLTIKLNPPKPVKIIALMSMQNPADQAKALGLESSAD